ncbi:MAG: type II toxin-antitoxin system VapC family toxin [Planctomycetota bacterium]
MIVADTNLIAYYLIEGEKTAESRAVRARDPHWLAPLLWRYEFKNILVLHGRRSRIPHSHLIRLWEEATEILAHGEFSPQAETVLQIAGEHHISAYDAEFVALAREQGVPLVTTDAELLSKFPGMAQSPADFIRRRDPPIEIREKPGAYGKRRRGKRVESS